MNRVFTARSVHWLRWVFATQERKKESTQIMLEKERKKIRNGGGVISGGENTGKFLGPTRLFGYAQPA